MQKHKIILRADGNSKIGLGHVYRLLALAQILNKNFECVFVINSPDEFVLNEINEVCASCIQLKGTASFRLPDTISAEEEMPFDLNDVLQGDEIVVTDGYLFGRHYQQMVKAKGCYLVCIDDLATTEFYADVVINHAPGIDKRIYKVQPYTQLLTGLEYSILRQPFFESLSAKKEQPVAFVSLGGSDHFEYSYTITDALLQVNQWAAINILTSSSFSSQLLDKLQSLRSNHPVVSIHHNVDDKQLVQLLNSCTHAFVASSTVLFESFARGLKCFTGYYTANQKFIYDGFTSNKFAAGLGKLGDFTVAKLQDALLSESSLQVLKQNINSSKRLADFFQTINADANYGI